MRAIRCIFNAAILLRLPIVMSRDVVRKFGAVLVVLVIAFAGQLASSGPASAWTGYLPQCQNYPSGWLNALAADPRFNAGTSWVAFQRSWNGPPFNGMSGMAVNWNTPNQNNPIIISGGGSGDSALLVPWSADFYTVTSSAANLQPTSAGIVLGSISFSDVTCIQDVHGVQYLNWTGSGYPDLTARDQSVQLSLSPLSATSTVGSSHSVTAKLAEGPLGAPIVNAPIGFRVANGPNAGSSGYCGNSTASPCVTDSSGQISWTYSGSAPGTDTVQAFYDMNSNGVPDPVEPQTTAGVTWNPRSLVIQGNVTDYKPWIDPTGQPVVQLNAHISNADGTPAVGATVKFSNAGPTAVWTVPSSGTIAVVEDISKGVQDVTITAAKGSETSSKVVHIFDVAAMTRCQLPGEARQTDAISSMLDNMIIADPGPLLQLSHNVIDLLGKAVSFIPDKVTTVGTAYKYTGTFTSIYQLSVNVTSNTDGTVVKQYPQVFSRNYDLVRPLFEGNGTPIQRIGRSLVCGVPA